jgi:hypothetical protein
MPTHLYCLLPATADATPPDGTSVRSVGDLAAWVADSPASALPRDVRGAARATVEHDLVIGAAVTSGHAVIPALLADPYASVETMSDDVQGWTAAIRHALSMVTGKAEMTTLVSVSAIDDSRQGGTGRGRAYLESLRAGPIRAAGIMDGIASVLKQEFGEGVRRAEGPREAISHLISRDAVSRYRAVALGFVGADYRVLVDGPRATYRFAAFAPRQGMVGELIAAA